MKASVLVIDDEAIIHESCHRIFEDEGYRVKAAFSLEEGLKILERGPFEVVVTDLKMPGGSGMDAIRFILERWEDTAVIMITGYSTVESAVEAMKLGALDYLPKPFTPAELVSAVEEALQRRRLGMEEREIQKTFQEALQGMHETRDLEEVLRLIVESVVRLLQAKGSTVLLLDPKKARREVKAPAGLTDAYLQKGPLEAARSLAETLEGKRTWIPDMEKDPRVQYPAEALKEGVTSILSLPMITKGRVIGCLRLYRAEPNEFSEAEMELLDRFTEQVAMAWSELDPSRQLKRRSRACAADCLNI